MTDSNIPDADKATLLGEPQKIDMSTDSSADPHMDLYEHELVELSNLMERVIEESRGRPRDRGRWESEIIGRFAEIGFVVSVHWWTTNVPDVLMPEINIEGRVDSSHEFDHDQQVYEIVNDVLGTGERGYIREDGSIKDPGSTIGGFGASGDD